IGVQYLSLSNAKWRTLKVTNTGGEPFEFQDLAPPGASYSLFAGKLPQGTYQMSQLETIGNAPGLLLALMASDFKEISAEFGTFTIKPATATNLGTIVFALPKDKKGPPFKVAILAGEAGLGSAYGDLPNATQARIADWPRMGWDKSPSADSA